MRRGRSPGSSSKLPAGANTRPLNGAPGTTEPQRSQNERQRARRRLPGHDVFGAAQSKRSPRARRYRWRTASHAPCGSAPQWQWCMKTYGPSSSHVTSPHRQLARLMAILLGVRRTCATGRCVRRRRGRLQTPAPTPVDTRWPPSGPCQFGGGAGIAVFEPLERPARMIALVALNGIIRGFLLMPIIGNLVARPAARDLGDPGRAGGDLRGGECVLDSQPVPNRV